jgi:hypothetical protein
MQLLRPNEALSQQSDSYPWGCLGGSASCILRHFL